MQALLGVEHRVERALTVAWDELRKWNIPAIPLTFADTPHRSLAEVSSSDALLVFPA